MYSVHAELDDYDGATTVLMEALPKFPENKIYWQQLPQLLLKLGRDADALAYMELAYKRGLLEKESEIKNLAALYGQFDAPYKAAEVLSSNLKGGLLKPDEKIWKQTGQNWSLAKEYLKAIDAYGEAAKLASDGTYFQYQGELYSELEKWKEASTAFAKALEKGGLKDPGRIYLNLGVAQYNAGNTSAAVQSLEKALQYDKSRGHANSWLQFINAKVAQK
jgi:tetratricopeptide (TPR) repeat protein